MNPGRNRQRDLHRLKVVQLSSHSFGIIMAIYTSRGHRLRIFELLKIEGQQRVQFGVMLLVHRLQKAMNRLFEQRRILVISRGQALLLVNFHSRSIKFKLGE